MSRGVKSETTSNDKELELYRGLLKTPDEFKDGFGWSTVTGIIFCALIMVPGSIYLGLMTGGDMGSTASWVTLILFAEVARRALKPLTKQNMVVLLHAAGTIMAGGVVMGSLVQRAYFVGSDAMRDAGMSNSFPSWWAPSPDSAAILERNLLHPDWFIPIGILVFLAFLGIAKKYTLGYLLFRITSDIERLPFPMAPIAAQGTLALAEEQRQSGSDSAANAMEEGDGGKKLPTKWRLFSLGAILGMTFGFLQVGIPALTGLFLAKPVFLLPQPFLDTTVVTESILPATATGLAIDMGAILLGFVLPFWAVMGTFAAIVATIVLNPILYHFGILNQWQPGMDTVNTVFLNNMDFWLSFGVGAGLGVFLISIYSLTRDLRKKNKELKARDDEHPVKDTWQPPRPGRGDYPLWMAVGGYVIAATLMIVLIHFLVPALPVVFLVIFSFFYSPFVSYVNARLIGINGQGVDIPMVREGFFIFTGAKGIDIWLAPIPIENYGGLAQSFRINELTGVSFFSLLKADLVATPVIFIASLLFWSFLWKSNPIPSDIFPTAQLQWELAAKNNALLWSSTFVPPGEDPATRTLADSEFAKAIRLEVIASGAAITVVMFSILSVFGLPVMFVYGIVRGLGSLPHGMILEVVGAMIGRFYLQKKFGQANFLRMAPTVLAGYFTGVGLMAMATISMNLIKQAITGSPF